MSNAIIGALRVTLGLDSAAFEGGLTAAQKHLKDVGRQMERIGGQMQAVGARMSMALTAPIVAFGALAVRAAGDFESSMNRVQALTSATGDELSALKDQARELGAVTQFSASDAADAMGFLAQAGMKTNDIMAAMPQVLTLAGAAQLDMARAADIVTNVLSGYNLEISQLAAANDTLVAAFTKANTDLEQLAEAMKYAGPVASAAGVQFEEAAAALSLMGNAGIQGSMAGTSLRGAIARILSPTKQMQAAMKAAGLSFTDARGRLLPLEEIVRRLEPHAENAGLFMQLFGQRAGPAMAALVTQGADAVKNLTGELENAAGTAARISGVQMQGFNGMLKELESAFEELQLRVSESGLMAFVEKAGLALTGLMLAIAGLPDPVLGVGVAIAAVVAALGPLILAAGALIASIGVILPALGAVGAALAAIPLLPIIAGVAAVTAAFLLFGKHVIAAVRTFGAGLASELGPKIAPLFEALKGLVQTLGAAFSAIFGSSGESTVDLTTWGRVVGRILGAAVDVFTGAIRFITHLLRALGALLRGDFSAMWNALGSAVGAAVLGIARAFQTLFPQVAAWVRRTYTEVKAWLMEKLGQALTWVIDKVKDVGKAFFKLYDAVVGNSYVPDMVTEIGQWMARLDDNMVKPAARATDKTAKAFERMRDRVAAVLDSLMTERESLDLGFRREMAALDEGLAKGGIDQRTYDEAVRRALARYRQGVAAIDGAGLTMPRLTLPSFDNAPELKAVNDTIERMNDAIEQSRDRFADAFADGVEMALRGDWKGLLQSIVGDVFRNALRNLGGQLFNHMGGGANGLSWGKVLSSVAKFLPGFKNGGSFTVGGSGGPDSKIAMMRVSPRERVDVSTVRQQREGGVSSVVRIEPSKYFEAVVSDVATPIAATAAASAVRVAQKVIPNQMSRRQSFLVGGNYR